MILQALEEYYRRKVADPDAARRLPALGLEDKEVRFILELAHDGRLVSIKDTRNGTGRTASATRYRVPKGAKKTSGVAANLLWDNAEYLLGIPDVKKLSAARAKSATDNYLGRLKDMHAAFRARIAELPGETRTDDGVRAVEAFLSAQPIDTLRGNSAWAELADSNPVLSFRLATDQELVCQRPAVLAAVASSQNESANDSNDRVEPALCLVTGNTAPPERLHTAIKGVRDAQTSGANIVSFNLEAFCSFGKAQGANAPVSPGAAFAYTTALNHLLGKGSRQRMQVGDASTVFWAQRDDDADVEQWFVNAFGGDSAGVNDDPDARIDQVRAMLEAPAKERFEGARGEHRFYVLGLAPNAARIAVRFWYAATVAVIGQRIREWFEDLKIERGPIDPEFPTLFRLLTATAVLGRSDNVAPALGGDLMRAVLAGTPLPASLLQAAVQRCRAEQARKDAKTGKPVPHVNYHRAALMKACLNRQIRRKQLPGEEITMALDSNNIEPAYLAGRLFAAYERVQSDAADRELNRSIRDAYFGTAMSNPATVFPRLIQLNQHHMRDLRRGSPGLHAVRDRLIGQIWDRLPADKGFPHTLPLAERARFALGYYHQRQAFFAKAETPKPGEI